MDMIACNQKISLCRSGYFKEREIIGIRKLGWNVVCRNLLTTEYNCVKQLSNKLRGKWNLGRERTSWYSAIIRLSQQIIISGKAMCCKIKPGGPLWFNRPDTSTLVSNTSFINAFVAGRSGSQIRFQRQKYSVSLLLLIRLGVLAPHPRHLNELVPVQDSSRFQINGTFFLLFSRRAQIC